MANISDYIEEYLKSLLLNSKEGTVEIQRNELAGRFQCVPSQINYVLSTRFNWDRGYLVESRRGGGGFVRIVRVVVTDEANADHWYNIVKNIIGESITQPEGEGLVARLYEERIISQREKLILQAILDRGVLRGEGSSGDFLRARILKSALLATLKGE